MQNWPRIACWGALLLMTTAAWAGPPVAPVQSVTTDYHGTSVADPYRYMEEFKQPAVQEWVKGQADYAAEVLAAIPGRDALMKRLTELDAGVPYRVYGFHRRPQGELFYYKHVTGEPVAKVYHRAAGTTAETLLIDPMTLAAKPGDHHALSFYRVSPDGQWVAYGAAASGSEKITLRIIDVATGKHLPEAIDRIDSEYTLPVWLPDSSGFFYCRKRKLADDAPATDGFKFTQAFRHRLKTDPEQDQLIFAADAAGAPQMAELDFPSILLTKNSRYVVGKVKHGDETDLTLYAAPLAQLGTPEIAWMKICDRSDQVTDFALHNDEIFLLTASNAPRHKVIRTSLAKPDFPQASVVIPAGDSVVEGVIAAPDALYVEVLSGVLQNILRIEYAPGAQPVALSLPAEEPSAFVASVSATEPGIWLATRSWSRAGRTWSYDPATQQLTDIDLQPRGPFDDPDWLTSSEALVPSHDGVKVPLSILYRRDLVRDGSAPTLISGYGGYGMTDSMGFTPENLAWLERGGVLAIAHVRGGGVYGKEWHLAGRRQTKPNTWKDFIACAEYLVHEKFTSPGKLAGKGGSAGGILIGRAITERPDLFAAAQISVGCSDMLRFETTENGPPNIPEFGTTTLADNFPWMLRMSSYHQVRDGVKYPAVILTHGINDPRVEPWQSAKMTARLQAATASGRPVIFRVDYHSGHGIGSTKAQYHAERADVWAYFLWQFGVAEFQPQAQGEPTPAAVAAPLKALIVDGQNNHQWQATTPVLKEILEETKRFHVTVATAPPKGETKPVFAPQFTDYDVVVLNYNGEPWPAETQAAFVAYVRGGGGVAVVHAANNSFPEWSAYNQLIGLGGWGGRTEKDGPYLRFKQGKVVRDLTPGAGGSHGQKHEFVVEHVNSEHPITAGLPTKWKHTSDELYDRLRGPAENLTLLAVAYSDPATGGTGLQEPILFTVDYGRGRVFHTVLGHDVTSMKCAGFATTLQRGAEWAASNAVTLPVPQVFPQPEETLPRK